MKWCRSVKFRFTKMRDNSIVTILVQLKFGGVTKLTTSRHHGKAPPRCPLPRVGVGHGWSRAKI
jgi:hypothetical protein